MSVPSDPAPNDTEKTSIRPDPAKPASKTTTRHPIPQIDQPGGDRAGIPQIQISSIDAPPTSISMNHGSDWIYKMQGRSSFV